MVPKIMKQGKLTPWLYLSAALIVLLLFIVYPTIRTITLSFKDKQGTQPASADCVAGEPCWGVFENYRYALTNPEMLQALRNNTLWILLMVPGTVGAGLLFAALPDPERSFPEKAILPSRTPDTFRLTTFFSAAISFI